jgi:hypothetical protein
MVTNYPNRQLSTLIHKNLQTLFSMLESKTSNVREIYTEFRRKIFNISRNDLENAKFEIENFVKSCDR